MEVKTISEYVRVFSNDYYLTKQKGILSFYDYQHNLIDRIKKNNTMAFVILSNDVVCFTGISTKYLCIWKPKEKSLKKINYTKLVRPNIKAIFEKDDNICIYYYGAKKNPHSYNSVMAYINKQSLEVKTQELDENKTLYIKQCFMFDGNLYYTKLDLITYDENGCECKFECSYGHQYDYECKFSLYLRENGESKKLICTSCFEDILFKISENGKYAFLITNDLLEPYCKIKLYDFKQFKQLNEIEFYHISLYRLKAEFINLNNEEYIVYQANPKKCDVSKDEVWSTYIYSIKEEKIIYESSRIFDLKYIKDKKILIVVTNHRKNGTIFYHFDDEADMSWVIENILKKLR